MNGTVIPFTRLPVIVVRPIGHAFAATVLRRRDGRETRLQIFPDPQAAVRSAELLNDVIREAQRS